MFETIKSLRPYFFSLREVDNSVSLDIKLPITWKYDEIIKPYSLVKPKVQDKNEKFTLLSLVAVSNDTGYSLIFDCASEIINVNKEEEEKSKLFQKKVKELEKLFKSESLNKLKEITFLEYGQKIETGIQDRTGEEIIGEGETEIRDGYNDPQKTND
jgi:hypothetical protein